MKKLFSLVVLFLLCFEVFACAAITKKGTQCKRAPSPGSTYCWQHGGTTKAQRAAGLTYDDVAKMRCKATTKEGTQCSRTSQTGSDFCWQHVGTRTMSEVKKGVSEEIKDKDIDKAPSRCEAITKKGTRCTRKAQPGTTKCWQHQ